MLQLKNAQTERLEKRLGVRAVRSHDVSSGELKKILRLMEVQMSLETLIIRGNSPASMDRELGNTSNQEWEHPASFEPKVAFQLS